MLFDTHIVLVVKLLDPHFGQEYLTGLIIFICIIVVCL